MNVNNDITGQKFNKLTAIKRVGSDKNRRALWLCKCDCGNEFIAAAIERVANIIKPYIPGAVAPGIVMTKTFRC